MEQELLEVTKKSGIVLGGGLIFQVFSLLFSLVAARLIGAKGYGQYTYILALVMLLPTLGTLGFYSGLIYFLPKLAEPENHRERGSLIGFCCLCACIVSVCLVGLVIWQSNLLAGHWLNKPDLIQLLQVMTPLGILFSLISVLDGAYVGTGRVKTVVWAGDIVAPLAKVALAMLLALLGWKVWGLVAGIYLGAFCELALLILQLRRSQMISGFSKQYLPSYSKIMVFSFPLVLASCLLFLNTRMNTYIIGYYLSTQQVGIFNVAWRVGGMSIFVYNIFNSMFAPVIASLYHQGEIEKLSQIFKAITKWMVAGNLLVLSLILLFSVEIMRFFGPDFRSGATALVIIALGQVINAGTGSAGAINTLTGHSTYELYGNLFGLLTGLGLNYVLIPRYGINGAAVTSLVTIGLVNLIRIGLVYRDHRIHPYSWSYLKVAGACLGSLLITGLLKRLIDWNWLLKLSVLSSLDVALFGGLILLFGLSPAERMVLHKLAGKWRNLIRQHD